MKFLGKMCFKIILKVTKNEDFTRSLEDTFFDFLKNHRGGRFDPLPPLPSPPPPPHRRTGILGLKQGGVH